MKNLVALFFLCCSLAAQAQWLEINTLAGIGIQGYSGDGDTALFARIEGPNGVAADNFGNVFFEDFFNNRVRKVNTVDIINTFAGNGICGNAGDGSIAANAQICPNGVAVDNNGNLYISDKSYSTIRKVDAVSGIISTFAGSGYPGFFGDSGLAINALLNVPQGMAVDINGNLFVADVVNHRVRKITADSGKIFTVAGNGTAAFTGDGGFAINANLDSPLSVAVDKIGNLYIADYKNNVIRKVDTSKIISTYAGIYGMTGFTGDGGPANLATLNGPKGIAVDKYGDLYIADAFNNKIRMVDTLGNIYTIVGNGTAGFGGDGGPAIGANLNFPQGVALDSSFNIYIADANNQRVRKVYAHNTSVVKNISSKNNINIFPNPSSNYIQFSNLKPDDEISIKDLLGREIIHTTFSTPLTNSILNIQTLKKGVYILNVYSKSGENKGFFKLEKL